SLSRPGTARPPPPPPATGARPPQRAAPPNTKRSRAKARPPSSPSAHRAATARTAVGERERSGDAGEMERLRSSSRLPQEAEGSSECLLTVLLPQRLVIQSRFLAPRIVTECP